MSLQREAGRPMSSCPHRGSSARLYRGFQPAAVLTREASQPIVPSTKANIELNVKTHAPRQTIAIVRTPAGRSARRRS